MPFNFCMRIFPPHPALNDAAPATKGADHGIELVQHLLELAA